MFWLVLVQVVWAVLTLGLAGWGMVRLQDTLDPRDGWQWTALVFVAFVVSLAAQITVANETLPWEQCVVVSG